MKLVILLGVLFMAQAKQDLYSIPLQTLEGKETTLAPYKGKTLLIVNTASKCGYTPQYDQLEALYAKYKDKGLVVLGFPSNDFGAQEPGSASEIITFCQTRFHIDFPMFAKNPVKGPQKQALYAYLTQNGSVHGEIKWNFEKFLVSPEGQVVGRFDPGVTPSDPAIVSAVEKNLPK